MKTRGNVFNFLQICGLLTLAIANASTANADANDAGIREGGGGNMLEDRVKTETHKAVEVIRQTYGALTQELRANLPARVQDGISTLLAQAEKVELSATNSELHEKNTGKIMDFVNDGKSKIVTNIYSWLLMNDCERIEGINHELFSIAGIEGSNEKTFTYRVAPSLFQACGARAASQPRCAARDGVVWTPGLSLVVFPRGDRFGATVYLDGQIIDNTPSVGTVYPIDDPGLGLSGTDGKEFEKISVVAHPDEVGSSFLVWPSLLEHARIPASANLAVALFVYVNGKRTSETPIAKKVGSGLAEFTILSSKCAQ